MAETFGKKEKEKRKQQKREEKAQKKAERQSSGKSGFEDMIAYVDENGNLSSTPPDPAKKNAVSKDDIVIGSRNIGGAEAEPLRKGRVTFFNTSKGYGFIKDTQTQESIFVHANSLTFLIKENDMVSFQTERGVKGPVAVSVQKI